MPDIAHQIGLILGAWIVVIIFHYYRGSWTTNSSGIRTRPYPVFQFGAAFAKIRRAIAASLMVLAAIVTIVGGWPTFIAQLCNWFTWFACS